MGRKTHILLILFIFTLLPLTKAAAQTPTPGPPPKDPRNLLENPSFEVPFEQQVTDTGGGLIANGWQAWWYDDAGDNFDTPEYKQADISIDPNRIRSGGHAQQYFRPWARHRAGVYQVVEVPENSIVQFSIYGHTWSTNAENPNPRDSFDGGDPGQVDMRVGIDPTGKENPFSTDVRWSATKEVYDDYERFSLQVQADGDEVTVFTYSSPRWPWATNNVYWDDAALIVVREGQVLSTDDDDDDSVDNSPVLQEPTPDTLPDLEIFLEDVVPAETQPARDDGSQYHTVQPGESLLKIAVAYGISPNELRAQNGLTTETIFVGQELFISDGGATAEPQETDEGQEPAAAGILGQICFTVFVDTNGDGQWGTGEPLVEGGLLDLTGEQSATLSTTVTQAAQCFSDLPSGDYSVDVNLPEGLELAGQSSYSVSMSQGSEVAFNVPVVNPSEPPEEVEAAEVDSAPETTNAPDVPVIGVVAVFVVALLGGVGTYFFITSRGAERRPRPVRSTEAQDPTATWEPAPPPQRDPTHRAPTLQVDRPEDNWFNETKTEETASDERNTDATKPDNQEDNTGLGLEDDFLD